ncbi:MAG TPA: nicotinate-nucleotide diphosphorylase (carboxylating), partial [bacterium]|nr:nicotinate-nucleotide diphosphorylase (carboxylating) [bacterium]
MNELSAHLHQLLLLALQEDLGQGDITSLATIGEHDAGHAPVRAKQDLVVSGTRLLKPLWEIVDPEVTVDLHAGDGDRLRPGDTLAVI